MWLPWNKHSKWQTRESYYVPYTVFITKMSNELSFTQMTQTLSKYVCTTVQRCGEICRNCGYAYAPHKTDIYKSMILRLGPATSRALPFINSLSGRDTTSYPYTSLERRLLNRIMEIDIPALEDFADGDHGPPRITAQVVKQANELVVSVYANMGDMFERANLGKLRVHTFLNNKSTLLTLLYSPRRAHNKQFIKYAALATAIDKSAHICNSNVEPREDYGWTVEN